MRSSQRRGEGLLVASLRQLLPAHHPAPQQQTPAHLMEQRQDCSWRGSDWGKLSRARGRSLPRWRGWACCCQPGARSHASSPLSATRCLALLLDQGWAHVASC